MRDYAKIAEALRYSSTHICNTHCGYYEICHRERQDKYASNVNIGFDAADAIEELLAFAKFVARQAIDTGDNDGVSAEILCRKLNKLGLIETDGEFWMLPEPPKVVE